MKKNLKLSVFVLLTCLIAMTGCKKEKDETLEEQLMGKWERQSAFYEFFENGIKTGEQGDTFDPNEWVYEFITDGNGNIYEKGVLKNSFSWTLTDSDLAIQSPFELTEGEISIKNGIMTLQGSDSSTANGINYESKKIITFKKL